MLPRAVELFLASTYGGRMALPEEMSQTHFLFLLNQAVLWKKPHNVLEFNPFSTVYYQARDKPSLAAFV